MDLRKNANDGYEGQADRFKVKVKNNGKYDVVGLKYQRRCNANGKHSVRLTLHVLGAHDPKDKEAVASTFRIDLWADWKKKFNADRIAWLLKSCGADDTTLGDFDPDSDPALVNGITGIPFNVQIKVTTRKGSDGVDYTDCDLLETKDLPKAMRQKYMDDPDWKKLVGPKEERVEEAWVAERKEPGSGGGRGGRGAAANTGGQAGDPYAAGGATYPDEDLPF